MEYLCKSKTTQGLNYEDDQNFIASINFFIHLEVKKN